MKYHGILLDEYLLRSKQVSRVNAKLNQTTSILSKLKCDISSTSLKTVCHSLYGSHLQYNVQLGTRKFKSKQHAKTSEPNSHENYHEKAPQSFSSFV